MSNNNNVEKKPSKLITLKNMQIPYNSAESGWKPRNFSGREVIKNGKLVNREGEKNFCIFLDPEQVDCEEMIAEGWNISKNVNEKDPQAEPSYMLRIKVKFHPDDSDLKRLNPKILVCTQNGEMMYDDDNVGDLDSAQIVKANLTIRGTWRVSQMYTGYVAYLSKLVARVYEDDGSLDDLRDGIMDD